MQPVLTQVPPNCLRSIIATFIPVSASRTARGGPAWPVPIMIASYLVAIGIPPLVYKLEVRIKKAEGKEKTDSGYGRLQFSRFLSTVRTTCTLSRTTDVAR